MKRTLLVVRQRSFQCRALFATQTALALTLDDGPATMLLSFELRDAAVAQTHFPYPRSLSDIAGTLPHPFRTLAQSTCSGHDVRNLLSLNVIIAICCFCGARQ